MVGGFTDEPIMEENVVYVFQEAEWGSVGGSQERHFKALQAVRDR